MSRHFDRGLVHKVWQLIKNELNELDLGKSTYLPGASQRLPVNVGGQLQTNPAPFGTHCPPFRPKKHFGVCFFFIFNKNYSFLHGFGAHGFRG